MDSEAGNTTEDQIFHIEKIRFSISSDKCANAHTGGGKAGFDPEKTRL